MNKLKHFSQEQAAKHNELVARVTEVADIGDNIMRKLGVKNVKPRN